MIDLTKFGERLDGKAVYVYGLGKSGLASVKALAHNNINVIAWDSKEEQRLAAEKLGAEICNEEDVVYEDLGCVLLSPGIPLTHPEPHAVVKKARNYDIEVVGDIEVLGRVLSKDIKTIGITGTNGKSTTTALLGHVLNECGVNAVIAGNIGTPVLSLDIKQDMQVIVLEMSSYQIDLCPSFRPDIAVLLNITPDHIERHGSLGQYAAVKAKIFGHQTRPIISIDDPLCEEIFDVEMELGKAPILLSLRNGVPFDTNDLKTLAGAHNHQNALAVYHVCKQFELPDADILAAMKMFPGLAHRQQIIREIDDVTFINDSKATNAEAAGKALGTYENIYWILGGQAKEGGLQGLEQFSSRIKKAYLIGEAAAQFSEWLRKENIPFEVCEVLEKAVPAAYEEAKTSKEKAVVLLSPACASWDQFKSFEHRGEVFEAEVLKL